MSVPSATSSSSLWVVVTKISLFRCLLHINTARKVVTVHVMRWQQLFLRSFGLSHLPFKSIGHVLLSWASWKVPLAVGMRIWDMLAMSERIFILGHPLCASYLWGPMLGLYYVLAISSDSLLSSNKPMAQHIILGPYPHNSPLKLRFLLTIRGEKAGFDLF